MCEECYGVPYETKEERALNFGLRYDAHTTNALPEIQNMKLMTLADARRFLDQFGKLFPETKAWRERTMAKFLQVDFAEIERRFLAHIESRPEPGDRLAMFAGFYRFTNSGRFSGSNPNQASTSSSHSAPTNHEPAPAKG